MEESPLDQLNVQIPGRLLAIEIIVLLMLHLQPRALELLKFADDRLNELEAHLVSEGAHSDQVLTMFGAARAIIDQFIRDLPRD